MATTEQATLALTLAKIVRKRNSYYGNPSYLMVFVGGAALKTAKDSAMAYEVTESWVGKTFYVKTDSRGDIINMTALRLQ